MKKVLYFLVVTILLTSCAKIVTPVGGPKDTTPPRVLRTQPKNQSVKFVGKQIKISFDEFFTLNNPNANILISPPPAKQPDYIISNKSLIIKFKDTLHANTTYNIVFSNCLRDYHEGNPINYYHYSFSTGAFIDSFSISGFVRSAQTLQPQEDFFVMLYRQNADSVPRTTLPDYVSKTLKDGSFAFRNIAAGEYKIFALKDINNNLLFDLPNEEIAFFQAPVTAHSEPKMDTTRHILMNDTAPKVNLFSFMEKDTVPKLLKYINPSVGIYHFPYQTDFNVFTASPLGKPIRYFQTTSASFDTITWYLREPLKDTLSYIFSADEHLDTVQIAPFKSKPNVGFMRGNRNTDSDEKLGVSFTNTGQLYRPVTLHFAYPIQPIDTFTYYIYEIRKSGTDTIISGCNVPNSFITDLPLSMELKQKTSYTIMIPDSVFIGYNGLTNDTLRTQFTTKSERDYGNLLINYMIPHDSLPYIAQLWAGNALIQQDILKTDQQVSYTHLLPGSYKIRVIRDENHNNRWDTGNYRAHKQPESVYYYSKDLNVRAFWDEEEDFTIGE